MEGGLRAIEANSGLFQPILARLQSDLSELLTMCRISGTRICERNNCLKQASQAKKHLINPCKKRAKRIPFRVSGIDGMLTSYRAEQFFDLNSE